MTENLIWVDIYDKERGQGTKEDTHIRGELHRAFSLFILCGENMLLQKRADEKYHNPGL